MRISDWSSDVCSSDLAEAVAAPDARREVFEEGEVAEALRQVLGLDDGVAAAPAAGSLQLGGADLSQPLCALAAQPLQAGEAADRSEARRAGEQRVSPCRSRWSRFHKTKTQTNI